MAGRIAVVTDASACIGADDAARADIAVVALPVAGLDSPDPPADPVMAERTSRPTPAAFAQVYRELLAAGATGIVSVHLSSLLSGTCDSARIAAREVDPARIRIVDSRTVAMGLGLAAHVAADAAARGETLDRVRDIAAEAADRSTILFTVGSLDRLRRGGRIGPTAALLGGVLAIKPILTVRGGEVVLHARVRTARRAAAYLEDAAVTACAGSDARVVVHQLAAQDAAAALSARLSERLPEVGPVPVIELAGVVAAHTGPGTIGVVVLAGEAPPEDEPAEEDQPGDGLPGDDDSAEDVR